MSRSFDTDPKLLMLAEQHRQKSLTDLEVLTEFVVHNAELEQLEDKLRQFNIFEAVGMQWQEIRHSAFLAFLLDPQQTHGLGDDFLKKLLQLALLSQIGVALPVNVVSLHLMQLDSTVVEREWSNIDILLLNEEHHLAVIVENKLQTGEHDNQLDRYFRIVERQYPGWRILALYLTVDGAVASDPRYLPISYAEVADIIGTLVVSRETVLGPDVLTLMNHYVRMLRRNIVRDAELDELCHQIYRRHKRAIDLIIARIPDKQAIVQEQLLKMVGETPGVRLQWHSKRQLTFHPEEWDVPALQYAQGNEAPSLIFQFRIVNSDHIKILLEIGPATLERRQRLFDMAVKHGKPFRSQTGKLRKKWNAVYSRLIVARKQMPHIEPMDIISESYKQWSQFLDHDLTVIKRTVEAQEWVWETLTTDTSEAGAAEEPEGDEDDDEQ